jgi:hypothetical protein
LSNFIDFNFGAHFHLATFGCDDYRRARCIDEIALKIFSANCRENIAQPKGKPSRSAQVTCLDSYCAGW